MLRTENYENRMERDLRRLCGCRQVRMVVSTVIGIGPVVHNLQIRRETSPLKCLHPGGCGQTATPSQTAGRHTCVSGRKALKNTYMYS